MSKTGFEEPLDLGQVLIGQGLVSEDAVRECLQIQRDTERTGRDVPVPRLGELLVQRGYVTEKQVVEALASQQKTILFCPRCDVQVNVMQRSDVREYKCARCEGTLVQPGSNKDLKVIDSSIIFISKDPVPKEVIEAAKEEPRRFGKYILVNEIGRGAVGIIHRAWDTYLNQYVALKMIKPPPELLGDKQSWHETRVLSLFKEARSAVRLRHPNIVPIYDVGRINRDFFISMEYLEGATLAEHLKKARDEGGVSPYYEEPKKYLRIVRDICRALHYAHTRPAPIIHCDLKPSNVFIDRTGRGYVLDFGLAKDLRTVQPDQPGTIRGTPSYMAPEQASGNADQIDARTDVYGLGAILYEMLAGRPPFVGDTMEILRQAIREKPLRPSEVVVYPPGKAPNEATTSRLVKIPPELENICLRCLEKDRSRRFATAKEVFEALDELLRGAGTQRREAGLTTVKPNKVQAPQIVVEQEAEAAAYDDHKSATVPSPLAARPKTAAVAAPSTGGSSWIWAAAGAVAMAGAFLLLAFALRLFSGEETAAWDDARGRIDAHLAAFRPDLAVAAAREAGAKDPAMSGRAEAALGEIDWVDRLRSRMISALNGGRPRIESLKLRKGEIAAAQILRADDAGVTAYSDGNPRDVAWTDLAPQQVAALARTALGSPTGAERFGLGVFLLKNGLLDAARDEFQSLLGTDLDVAARRYLERLN